MGAAVHASLRGSGIDDGAAMHYDWSHKYFDNNFKVLKVRNLSLQKRDSVGFTLAVDTDFHRYGGPGVWQD
jgi:hypothetical protein